MKAMILAASGIEAHEDEFLSVLAALRLESGTGILSNWISVFKRRGAKPQRRKVSKRLVPPARESTFALPDTQQHRENASQRRIADGRVFALIHQAVVSVCS
jgi:hypothetical protein